MRALQEDLHEPLKSPGERAGYGARRGAGDVMEAFVPLPTLFVPAAAARPGALVMARKGRYQGYGAGDTGASEREGGRAWDRARKGEGSAARMQRTRAQPNGPQHLSQSLYHRAMALIKRGDLERARALLREAVAECPADGRLWLAWAQMEARAGRIDDARRVFESGVAANARNTRLLHAWAVVEDRAGRSDVAKELFRRCLDIAPNDGIVWQSYALLEERCGRTHVARTIFQQGVDEDPENAYLWSAWGVLEQRHRQYHLAARLFSRAIDLNPRHTRTYQAWAITEEKLGRHNESEELFRRALDVDSRSAPTYQAYGLFEARRGHLDNARALFRRGLEIDPKHAPIWHAWAVMEQGARNFDDARNLFECGVNAAPSSTPMLRAWASMELELGHIDKSQDWLVPPGAKTKHRRGKRGTTKRARSHTASAASSSAGATDDEQISVVGENLKMLRLMIERRSDEDVGAVMRWLDRRARSDRRLYDKLAERQEKDSRKVKEWVGRRSIADVAAFKQFLEDRYEKDRRIGVYILNWDIPPMPKPVPVAVDDQQSIDPEIEKPVEWLRLAEQPGMGLQEFDEQLFYDDKSPDYAAGIYFVSQIAGNLADRAALLFCLGAMTVGLIGGAAYLDVLGYSPSGAKQPQRDEEAVPGAFLPQGVDAQQYEDDGQESISSAAKLKDSGA